MKILAINGSPNEKGSTAKLIDMLLDVCTGLGAECDKVNMEDYEIKSCRECRRCIDVGECVQEDDFIHLKAKMAEADGLIIGSPYYDGSAAEILDTFLLRILMTESIKKLLKGKYFVGIATSGSADCKKLAEYCANLGGSSKKSKIKVSAILYRHSIDLNNINDLTFDSKMIDLINKSGKNFVKDIKKRHSGIYLKIRRFFNFLNIFKLN